MLPAPNSLQGFASRMQVVKRLAPVKQRAGKQPQELAVMLAAAAAEPRADLALSACKSGMANFSFALEAWEGGEPDRVPGRSSRDLRRHAAEVIDLSSSNTEYSNMVVETRSMKRALDGETGPKKRVSPNYVSHHPLDPPRP